MGIIAIGAGIPVLAALLFGRFDAQTAPFIVVGVTLGPLLVSLTALALTSFVSWGADCAAVRDQTECGEFSGLLAVDGKGVSYHGAGHAVAAAIPWAAGGFALFFVGGIAFVILKQFW